MKPFFIVLITTIAAGITFGQTANGTLTGIVTDSSGAVIAGAPVIATHVDTDTRVTGATSQTGNYTIPQLPVGQYVSVSEKHFRWAALVR
jgi:hypothetical protein